MRMAKMPEEYVMNSRIQYIVEMYKKIYPHINVTEETLIKGTSIKTLCKTDGGPYQRIRKWCEDKLKTLTPTEVKKEENQDMFLAKEQYNRCFDLMKSRNVKYGDSWKVLTVQSIANLCEMKLHRIANMDTKNLDPKIEDELMDTANYMIFALIKLKQ